MLTLLIIIAAIIALLVITGICMMIFVAKALQGETFDLNDDNLKEED